MKVKQLKYKTIEVELRQLARTLPPDAKLPAERDLAIKYDCNFLTVRKALKQLVSEGLIIRRIGSGTFISPRRETLLTPTRNGHHGDRIGVLVYQQGNAYALSVLQAIAHAALVEAVDLRSCWIHDFAEDGLRQATILANEGCTALTLPWFPPERADELQHFVRHCPIPVSLPAIIPGLERYCFEETQLFGTTMLTATEGLCRYFTCLGRERIAFLGPDTPGDLVLQRQLSAYTCFMARDNRPMVCGLVDPSPRAMDGLARRWEHFRGDLSIVSYDDEHALRFLTSMHKLGLSAPGDFALVGYNDVDASHYSDPPLSTIRQNFGYIAHWLIKSALALARGEVRQSSQGPSLDLLVRSTCGGAALINDGMREELRRLQLNICLQTEPAAHPVSRGPAVLDPPLQLV